MFTGIVEEIGTIKTIHDSGLMTIEATHITKDIHIGDSISVNGVCLTVTTFTNTDFTVDVMPVTYHDTNLKNLSSKSQVNLERALPSNGRFGGHIVSGHVDTVGAIIKVKAKGNAVLYHIQTDTTYCLQKGSITIDGTSLTIFEVTKDGIIISLIPHTRSHTILGSKVVGDLVNIEFDILGKYVEKLLGLSNKKNSAITTSFLSENGFL